MEKVWIKERTPVAYDENQLGAIMAYADTGQPQLINSLSIAGMTVDEETLAYDVIEEIGPEGTFLVQKFMDKI